MQQNTIPRLPFCRSITQNHFLYMICTCVCKECTIEQIIRKSGFTHYGMMKMFRIQIYLSIIKYMVFFIDMDIILNLTDALKSKVCWLKFKLGFQPLNCAYVNKKIDDGELKIRLENQRSKLYSNQSSVYHRIHKYPTKIHSCKKTQASE